MSGLRKGGELESKATVRQRAVSPMPPQIRPAAPGDVHVILGFIRGLATYEKLLHEVEATEEKLTATLFGPRPAAECILAFIEGKTPAGFAIFFTNYSTFLAQSGLYLEDL